MNGREVGSNGLDGDRSDLGATTTYTRKENAMKKLMAAATVVSVAFFSAFVPMADAQSACPPEVTKAKEMLAQKSVAKGQDIQAPRTLAGARQEVQAPRGQEVQAPRGQEVQAPRGQEVQAPRTTTQQAPRGQEVQAPRSLAGARQEVQAPRGQEVQAPRGQEVQAPRGQEVQAPRGQEVQAPRGQEVQAPRGQEVQAPRGQEVQAPRGQEVQAPRGQEVQAPRTMAGAKQPAGMSKASSLVSEAEAACKAGDMKTAKAKAEAAISAMK